MREALVERSWIKGRNLRIDTRFGARDLNRIHDVAMELIRLVPEVFTNLVSIADAIAVEKGFRFFCQNMSGAKLPIPWAGGPATGIGLPSVD